MTTLALGLDPGATFGWGLVQARGSAVAHVLSGSTRSLDEVFGVIANAIAEGAVLLAVESVAHITPRGRLDGDKHTAMSSAIARAEFAGGAASGFALARDLRVERVSATEWRRWLIGRANADDRAIKHHLALHLRGLPKSSDEHERDGLGVAAFAAVAVELGIPFGHGGSRSQVAAHPRSQISPGRNPVKGVGRGR